MSAPAHDSYLSWEVFLLGGCSIIVCLACWAFTDKSASVFTMSELAFGLAFAVNHPHFLSSYVLLYNDFQKKIFQRPRYFWAAVIVPVLLGGYLVYALAAGRVELFGHALNAMFFLVGWHYTKQVFGCIIVTSARRKIYYNMWQRRIMLANLFSVWSMSFLWGQQSPSYMYYGMTYAGWGIPAKALIPYSEAAVVITAVAMGWMFLQKYINDGVKPSPPGMAALAALYVWYLPAFNHPTFAYLIPLFHSLQYLAFVWSFKKNQVADHISEFKDRKFRAAWVKEFLGYAAGVLVLGAMSFEFVPKWLDSQGFIHAPALGTAPILVTFLLFINVHHYFIDNVIWRSDNEQIKKYLFAPAPTEPVAHLHKVKAAA